MPTTLPAAIHTSLEILAASNAILRPGQDVQPMEQNIARVVELFDRMDIRWALIGDHAVGTLTEPRATADFDFVVEDAKLRRLLTALEREFGDLAPHPARPHRCRRSRPSQLRASSTPVRVARAR